MDFQPIQSSNIAGAHYDAERQVCTVKFKSGHTYAYSGVPENEYQELLTAPSAGNYLNEVIKAYPYRKV